MVGATLEENLAASFQVKHSFPMYVCIHTQLCLTLCDTMDYSPPGSSVHGILQIRLLEWVAMPCSRGSSQPMDRTCISCIEGRFLTTEPSGNRIIFHLAVCIKIQTCLLLYIAHLFFSLSNIPDCEEHAGCFKILVTVNQTCSFCVGISFQMIWGFPGGSDSKVSACNVGDPGSIPGLRRFLE